MRKLFSLCLAIGLPIAVLAGDKKVPVIEQDGKTFLLKEENTTIVLAKKAFTFRFYNKRYSDDSYYATMVSAFTNKASLNKAQIGFSMEDIPYFSSGTGLAAEATGYSAIFLDEAANHYLIYKDEEDKRADLVAEKDGWLELQWTPHSFYIDGKDKEFAETGIHTFYLVIMSDDNLNNKVDKGELKKVIITFQ